MGKKSLILISIIVCAIVILLALGVYNHVSFHKQDYKSAQHVYAGKNCVLIVPENWKDSVPTQTNSGSFIHLESKAEEAGIDIGVDSSAKYSIDDFESRFHQRLLEKYAKTYFNQLGNYSGRGVIMTGKIENKNEGYVKIFVYSDSLRSFFITEYNTTPDSKPVADDIQQIETSFRLK